MGESFGEYGSRINFSLTRDDFPSGNLSSLSEIVFGKVMLEVKYT